MIIFQEISPEIHHKFEQSEEWVILHIPDSCNNFKAWAIFYIISLSIIRKFSFHNATSTQQYFLISQVGGVEVGNTK